MVDFLQTAFKCITLNKISFVVSRGFDAKITVYNTSALALITCTKAD